MRIGIEAQRIFRKEKHGMDYVVLEELRQLCRMEDDGNEYYVFVKPGPDRCLQSAGKMHVVEIGCPSYPLWEQWALPRAARRMKVDLLHCTSNTAPIRCRVPLVLTLHDIIFLEPRDRQNHSLYQNMGWLYRRLVVPRVLPHCRRIITVSHYEQQNIVSRLGIEPERMAMIYNGYNQWFCPDGDNSAYKKYMEQPGFFFFLGNTDPKKNTERTLVAYARYLERSGVKRPLLMADLDRRYLDDIISRNNIEIIRPHLHLPGYIVNSDLPAIYRSAFAFLYPSLRESFGIPLLEAMACGTPVVTGSTSSLPEIAGTAALMVDAGNADAIADAMLQLEQDEQLYRQLSENGPERASLFSWRSTAEQLLRLYRDVSKEIRPSAFGDVSPKPKAISS